MKNLLYYVLIYLLLSLFTGVVNILFNIGHWIIYLLSIALLGLGSYLLDVFRVKIIKCEDRIIYIRRSFVYLKSRFYYKSLFKKIVLTLLGSYCLSFLFSIENSEYYVVIFLCLFAVVYVNIYPMFFIVVDARFLALYLKEVGSKNIHIEKCDKLQISCCLCYHDLKKVVKFNNSITRNITNCT